MPVCNVTGIQEGEFYEYYINGDFGYNANYLNDKRFSFVLSDVEHQEFIRTGREKLSSDMSTQDYTYQYGKWFTSEQVYDLISTFQKPPRGYFCDSWLQLEEGEEQRLWDHMEFDDIRECLHLFSEDRVIEIKKVLYIK